MMFCQGSLQSPCLPVIIIMIINVTVVKTSVIIFLSSNYL